MGEKRLTNSELHLNRLEEEDSRRVPEPGILELFDDGEAEPGADAPSGRDEEAPPGRDQSE